jgi:hypothetical protein|tara:strand:+ start:685 stop:1683 length:999 start_codon:yes stop_codon:yes gene_type:complete
MRTIKPTSLKEEVMANAKADVNTMIWSGPGLGKSEIVYQIAMEIGAKVFEIRANLFDPVDVRGGLKVVEQKDGSYRTRYGVPEDYPDPDYQGIVVLLIDELPCAPKATQNALLQLLTMNKVGTYQLPPNTVKIACGNRAKDRAAVHEMPTPVKTRFAHYELEANVDDWAAWAVQNDIDPSIISFIRFRPALLHNVDPNENASPTPRTWTYVSKKLPFMNDEFYGVASLVGDGAAGEFLAFKAAYGNLPTREDLLNKPTTTKVPDDISLLYAICGLVTSMVDKSNFDKLMKYVKRMPPEFQIYVMRDAMAKDRTLLQEKSFTEWTKANADVFL